MPFDPGEFGAASLREDGPSSDEGWILDVFGNWAPSLWSRKSQPRHKETALRGRSQPDVEDVLKDQSVNELNATIRCLNGLV